jgi:endonuclease/exonuclease/phosphatase family metal-dependent hydrolase
MGNEHTATGGLVSGVTATPVGTVRVVGICAPHHAASQIGAAEKARMWTEQVAFWNGLAKLIATRDRSISTVLLGDFNQYVPRIWGSKAAHAAMLTALDDLCVATSGPIIGIDKPTIDHVAHTPDLAPQAVLGLSRFDDDGCALSDHFGVVARLARPDM